MQAFQRSRSGGFSMMEVLVTIVIVAFGLLGFSGLLTKAVQDNRAAYMRTQATALAYDVIERMRLNRTAAINGSFGTTIGSTPAGTAIADIEIREWKAMLARTLPAGDSAINVDGYGNVMVTIQWDDNGDGQFTIFKTQSSI